MSGRKTGPWPKPNSSTNSAKLTATFLPAGQAATWIGSRGNPVTESVPSCAKVAAESGTTNNNTSPARRADSRAFWVIGCLWFPRHRRVAITCALQSRFFFLKSQLTIVFHTPVEIPSSSSHRTLTTKLDEASCGPSASSVEHGGESAKDHALTVEG